MKFIQTLFTVSVAQSPVIWNKQHAASCTKASGGSFSCSTSMFTRTDTCCSLHCSRTWCSPAAAVLRCRQPVFGLSRTRSQYELHSASCTNIGRWSICSESTCGSAIPAPATYCRAVLQKHVLFGPALAGGSACRRTCVQTAVMAMDRRRRGRGVRSLLQRPRSDPGQRCMLYLQSLHLLGMQ